MYHYKKKVINQTCCEYYNQVLTSINIKYFFTEEDVSEVKKKTIQKCLRNSNTTHRKIITDK